MHARHAKQILKIAYLIKYRYVRFTFLWNRIRQLATVHSLKSVPFPNLFLITPGSGLPLLLAMSSPIMTTIWSSGMPWELRIWGDGFTGT